MRCFVFIIARLATRTDAELPDGRHVPCRRQGSKDYLDFLVPNSPDITCTSASPHDPQPCAHASAHKSHHCTNHTIHHTQQRSPTPQPTAKEVADARPARA